MFVKRALTIYNLYNRLFDHGMPYRQKLVICLLFVFQKLASDLHSPHLPQMNLKISSDRKCTLEKCTFPLHSLRNSVFDHLIVFDFLNVFSFGGVGGGNGATMCEGVQLHLEWS